MILAFTLATSAGSSKASLSSSDGVIVLASLVGAAIGKSHKFYISF